MRFHEFFRARREELDLSLNDVVAKLARYNLVVSKSAVSSWNTGERQPKLMDRSVRNAIAAVLQVDVTEMMQAIGLAINDDDRSHEALYLADLADRLPEDGKELLIDYAQLLEERYLKKTALMS
jgi:transcriptional regulator with XRE-family HTH domain